MNGSTLFEAILQEEDGENEVRRPMTVTELNAEIGAQLERSFASVWVEGEVVGFNVAASGHWYFNLNDGTSQIRCACWKGTNFRIRFRPKNGICVRVRGRINFWRERGELSLSVDSLEPSGEGALAAAFQEIYGRLEREGLFAPELKRPLPFFPRRIGIVTTKKGAAFHDILTVITRRARSVSVVFAPASVQGEGAADSIRRALNALNEYNRSLKDGAKLDAVIVGRGGGSPEDLWAFNDEALARAIRASEIPVISAVGHEIDTTIADHAADRRAATPSDAAAIVAAVEEDLMAYFASAEERMFISIENTLSTRDAATSLAFERLINAADAARSTASRRYLEAAAKISINTLRASAERLKARSEMLAHRLIVNANAAQTRRKGELGLLAAKLDALSPLAALSRGYSVTLDAEGTIVTSADSVDKGDKLKIRLKRGTLDAEVLAQDLGDE
ncbi:MAG TPA: exodeoxyribonuclease VII large subunit [Pyrinomonadaceae bacterium]|nr:exodeoxyribonuclease VII large subunit [Pyrinomonadaceae bacterium]